ncbi:hypothetical protein ACFQU9_17315 [Actinomadura namibiensis]|nr:hypothetical protein [Actinomadura namibiensis]
MSELRTARTAAAGTDGYPNLAVLDRPRFGSRGNCSRASTRYE